MVAFEKIMFVAGPFNGKKATLPTGKHVKEIAVPNEAGGDRAVYKRRATNYLLTYNFDRVVPLDELAAEVDAAGRRIILGIDREGRDRTQYALIVE